MRPSPLSVPHPTWLRTYTDSYACGQGPTMDRETVYLYILVRPLEFSQPRLGNWHWIFTRGQYWPLGIVVACVCVYVCLSVNHELVRAIIHQPFKLGSLNLDQKCKRPWLRSLLFCGVITGDLQGHIELESQNLPHFWLVSLSGR